MIYYNKNKGAAGKAQGGISISSPAEVARNSFGLQYNPKTIAALNNPFVLPTIVEDTTLSPIDTVPEPSDEYGDIGKPTKSSGGGDSKKESEDVTPIESMDTRGVPADTVDKIQKSKYDDKLKAEMLDVARFQVKMQSTNPPLYSGDVDGMWGPKTQAAYEEYKGAKRKKVEESNPINAEIIMSGPNTPILHKY